MVAGLCNNAVSQGYEIYSIHKAVDAFKSGDDKVVRMYPETENPPAVQVTPLTCVIARKAIGYLVTDLPQVTETGDVIIDAENSDNTPTV